MIKKAGYTSVTFQLDFELFELLGKYADTNRSNKSAVMRMALMRLFKIGESVVVAPPRNQLHEKVGVLSVPTSCN